MGHVQIRAEVNMFAGFAMPQFETLSSQIDAD
jgi:hypothetical protein